MEYAWFEAEGNILRSKGRDIGRLLQEQKMNPNNEEMAAQKPSKDSLKSHRSK